MFDASLKKHSRFLGKCNIGLVHVVSLRGRRTFRSAHIPTMPTDHAAPAAMQATGPDGNES